MLEKELVDCAVVRITRVARDLKIPPEEPETKLMALDLFAGTRGLAKVLKKKDYTVITWDSDPKYMSYIRENIFTWDNRQNPPGFFAFIAASPSCTVFSPAKTIGVRNFRGAIAIVNKTLKMIQYFDPFSCGGWKPRGLDYCRGKWKCKGSRQ